MVNHEAEMGVITDNNQSHGTKQKCKISVRLDSYDFYQQHIQLLLSQWWHIQVLSIHSISGVILRKQSLNTPKSQAGMSHVYV